jgi:predicted nucleic acid-binding protein
VKCFVDEPGSPEARAIAARTGSSVEAAVVPDFCLLEVANALRYRSPAPGQEIAEGAAAAIVGAGFLTREVDAELVASAVRFAFAYDITVYDALYLALSVELGARLVTADLQMEKRVRGSGIVDLLV